VEDEDYTYTWSDEGGNVLDRGPDLTLSTSQLLLIDSIILIAQTGTCRSSPIAYAPPAIVEPTPYRLDTTVCSDRLEVTIEAMYSDIVWTDGPTGADRMLTVSQTYTFEALDSNGCPSDGEVNVALVPLPAIDYPARIETDECTTIQLSPGVSVPDSIQIAWLNEDLSCDSCFTPEYFVVQDTSLQYVVEHTASGCSEVGSVIIRSIPDLNLYIPNAISPNGDGMNDGFTVFTKNDRTIIENMRIFDRWGTLLFEGRNLPVNKPEAGWAGEPTTYSRNERVFIYIVQVRFLDGSTEESIGNVHVLR
jgi:gliding motility-associated-like protein